MRIALLGYCDGDVGALARAAHTALVRMCADRVVYLGGDPAIEDVVFGWTFVLDAVEPISERARMLIDAGPAQLEEELARERARRDLERLHALAGPNLRAVEMLHDRLVVLTDDKAGLDEEDLLPASFIVFGKGEAIIRRVGTRVFLCPGSPKKRTEGLLVLEEADNGAVLATLHEIDGTERAREALETSRALKMKVQGAAG
ncbi:MAG: hypothetical protein ACXWUG_25905 [Polyangiales bacterium]